MYRKLRELQDGLLSRQKQKLTKKELYVFQEFS